MGFKQNNPESNIFFESLAKIARKTGKYLVSIPS